jgi:putative DNA-invertase from lambdoid prophage Rac
MKIYAYSCTGIEEKAGENPRSEIENAGYHVARWFADNAATGLIPRTKEQQFTAMMHHLIAGDTLVVSKLLHLGRNAEDVLVTIQALEARQIDVIVLQLGQVKLASDTGKLMLKVLNAVVEMESHQPAAPAQSHSETTQPKGKTSSRTARLSRELRAKIITEYSQGVGIVELALRYNVSRTRIQGIVVPTPKDDEPLPFSWGD